jgi:hypothetical protein
MTHPTESELVAFLEGICGPEAAARVDAHLIDCEPCWQQVRQDRIGRHIAESLSTEPSPELRDRVRLAVEVAASAPSGRTDSCPFAPSVRRRRTLPRVGVAVAAIAGVAGIAGAVSNALNTPRTPAVTAVAETAKALPAHVEGAPRSEPIRVGPLQAPGSDQPLQMFLYQYESAPVVVAISTRQFPMPAGAGQLTKNAGMAWIGAVDGIELYCVNGAKPMLVAGRLPATRLATVATEVGQNP